MKKKNAEELGIARRGMPVQVHKQSTAPQRCTLVLRNVIKYNFARWLELRERAFTCRRAQIANSRSTRHRSVKSTEYRNQFAIAFSLLFHSILFLSFYFYFYFLSLFLFTLSLEMLWLNGATMDSEGGS